MVKMPSLRPFFILAICFALVFNRIGADSVNIPAGEDDLLQKTKYVGSDSELQQLESSLEEKTQELKKKDNEIALLQSKITSLQVNGGWLPVSIARRMSDLEKKWKEHGKPNADAILQKAVEKKAEALRRAESHIETIKTEDLKKAKAQSNTNEVMEVNGGWLPVSIARHMSDLEKKWKEHGKPNADAIMQKAVEKKAEALRRAESHIETIKTKWVPAAKEQWLITSANIGPHVHLLRDRALEAYVASKAAVTPHVLKVQESADPYFQEDLKKAKAQSNTNEVMEEDLKKAKAQSNTNEVMEAVEKKAEAVRRAEPHTETIKTAQGTVEQELKQHEHPSSFATKKLV